LNQKSVKADDYRQLVADNGLRGITAPFIDMNPKDQTGEAA
jgi:hypothetical protein